MASDVAQVVECVACMHEALGLLVYTCNARTQEVQAEGPELQDRSWLHSRFRVCLGYVRPCLKK